MLLNGFFEIISQTENDGELITSVHFNSGHEIYKAHFPGNPITPGVCIVEILKNIVCTKFEKDFVFSPVTNIKFLNVINPEDTPDVDFNVKYTLEDEKVKVNVTVTDNEKTFTKLNGYFN